MKLADNSNTSTLRVVWASGAYGYGGDLVYFRSIFGEFARRYPRGLVPVAKDFPVDRYPELPLRPVLGFYVLGRTRRQVGEVTYTGVRRIPSPATLRRFSALRPDVVLLVEFTPTALMGFCVAKLRRSRVVLLVESDPSYRGAPRSAIGRTVKRAVARSVDAVLVSNEIGARFVRDELRAPAHKVLVGPYLTSAPATPQEPAQVPGAEVRLLFLNSLTARKGLRQLAAAINLLPPGVRRRVRLDVVGAGPEGEPVRRLAAEGGWAEQLVLHGRVSHAETASFYAGTDLVVCPTLADYRSLSGFEAVNAGKPVLISRYDGAADELVREAPWARLVDPHDVVGFAQVLQRALEPAELAAAVAAAANVPPTFGYTRAADNLQRAITLAACGYGRARG